MLEALGRRKSGAVTAGDQGAVTEPSFGAGSEGPGSQQKAKLNLFGGLIGAITSTSRDASRRGELASFYLIF